MTRSNQSHIITLHTYTPKQCPYQVATSYTLRFLRFGPDKTLKVKVTIARSNVKSRSHNDDAHLHPLTNVPTKVSTSYTLRFLRYSPDKTFSRHPPARLPKHTNAHSDTMGENNTNKALKDCGLIKNEQTFINESY